MKAFIISMLVVITIVMGFTAMVIFNFTRAVSNINRHVSDIEESKDILKFLEDKNMVTQTIRINCSHCGGWDKTIKSQYKDSYIVDEVFLILPDGGGAICSRCVNSLPWREAQ